MDDESTLVLFLRILSDKAVVVRASSLSAGDR